jgi:G:T-mismatch repair DNA endonuclease (very short patch repair protein)
MHGNYCSRECYLAQRWGKQEEHSKASTITRKQWKTNRATMMANQSRGAKLRVKKEGLDKFIERTRKAQRLKPTKPEREMVEILENNNLQFKYVGNGEIIINGRNPDFINTNGKKQVIEIFGSYWHMPLLNPNMPDKMTEYSTKEHYAKYGFDCLVIWDFELKNPKKVLAKIASFGGAK